MCILKKIHAFVYNGATVLAKAAHGDYHRTSPNIERFNRELRESSEGPSADKRKLRQDRNRIYKDVSDAFEEYLALKK